MRVMVFVKATEDSERGLFPPDQMAEIMAAMDIFNAELHAAGIRIMGEGLKPSSAGKRIACAGASRTLTDGPFANPDELVAGFWLWEVPDMETAVAWAMRCPNPMPGPSTIEIRPMYEEADFG